jgi:hypothetical protein
MILAIGNWRRANRSALNNIILAAENGAEIIDHSF